MAMQFSPVPVVYDSIQPISCEVEDFMQNVFLPASTDTFKGIQVFADYAITDMPDGQMAVHVAFDGMSYADPKKPERLYFISTTTIVVLLNNEGKIPFPEKEEEKERYISQATYAAIALTRAHLFTRFQSTRHWKDYILPMLDFRDLVKKKADNAAAAKQQELDEIKTRGMAGETIKPTDDLV